MSLYITEILEDSTETTGEQCCLVSHSPRKQDLNLNQKYFREYFIIRYPAKYTILFSLYASFLLLVRRSIIQRVIIFQPLGFLNTKVSGLNNSKKIIVYIFYR